MGKFLKRLLMAGIVLVVWGIVVLGGLGFWSQLGAPPGLDQGRLSRCTVHANCVCSEYTDNDLYAIDPLPWHSELDELIARIVLAFEQDGGVLQSAQGTYLVFQFQSRVFRFIDDVEVRIDIAQKVVHVRSASRVGYRDFGVNRQRIERVRAILYTL